MLGHDGRRGSKRKRRPLPTEQPVLPVTECRDSPVTHFPVDFVSFVEVKAGPECMGCHTETMSYERDSGRAQDVPSGRAVEYLYGTKARELSLEKGEYAMRLSDVVLTDPSAWV